jgi:CRISPR/Cas system endoribonuclease Cas6 (RAMP superfamily)
MAIPLETVNPFVLWAQVAGMAWLRWIEAARTVMLPWSMAVVQSRIWKFTASFSEWEANRVVLERQAFYVRWARRPCKERASTVITRVTGGSGRGAFIF